MMLSYVDADVLLKQLLYLISAMFSFKFHSTIFLPSLNAEDGHGKLCSLF